tara:strand:+ start:2410 stop:2658 length:249 start_codon:yes stop_codon:yes gene_type:complete
MKKLLNHYLKGTIFFVFFISIFDIKAQTVNTSVASDMNIVFSLLEKNRIPYNILIDYGYDFIDVNQFNGTLQTNNYLTIGKK